MSGGVEKGIEISQLCLSMRYVVGCLGEPGEGMRNLSVRLRCTERGIENEVCVAMYRDLSLSLFAGISPHQVNFYKTFQSIFAHFDHAAKFHQGSMLQFSKKIKIKSS